MRFSNFFVPFCNQNGIIHIGKIHKPIIPFWLQKGTKKFENFTKIIFSETMASELSNDVPTMLRTFLEHILHFGEV